MTYRDDHDAALNRIAALEDELERTKTEREAAETKRAEAERERDRLASEVALAKPTPATIAVAAQTEALTTADVARVAEELERGARGAFATAWLTLLLGVVGCCFAVASPPLAVFGVLVAIAGMVSVWLNAPDQWRPVLAAVREAPSQIISIERRRIGGSLRPYRITVHTRRARLRLRGDAELCKLLERRCPDARLDD